MEVDPHQHLITRSQIIISDLTSLSKIKFGDRWDTYYKMPHKPGLVNKALRQVAWITRDEGRTITIEFIKTSLDTAFTLLEELKAEIDRAPEFKLIALWKNIKQAILLSQTGIVNLRGAYFADEDTKSDINSIIEYIKKRFTNFAFENAAIDDIRYASPPGKDDNEM